MASNSKIVRRRSISFCKLNRLDRWKSRCKKLLVRKFLVFHLHRTVYWNVLEGTFLNRPLLILVSFFAKIAARENAVHFSFFKFSHQNTGSGKTNSCGSIFLRKETCLRQHIWQGLKWIYFSRTFIIYIVFSIIIFLIANLQKVPPSIARFVFHYNAN